MGIDLAAPAITLGRQSLVRRCPADDQRRSGLERPFQMSELFCVRKMRRSHRGGTRPSLVQSVYTRPCTTLARPEARPPYSSVFSRRNPPPPPPPAKPSNHPSLHP